MGAQIRQLDSSALFDPKLLPQLVDIVRDAIEHNFSIGFLLDETDNSLEEFWKFEISRIGDGNIILVSEVGDRIVGVVIVTPERRSNGRHRGELRKLIVHSNFQNQGIGAELEATACLIAKRVGLSLLCLDSATDFLVARTYEQWGWQKVGSIPHFAAQPDGILVATTYFYKSLN
jgi:acetyltransferase